MTQPSEIERLWDDHMVDKYFRAMTESAELDGADG